MAAEIAYLLERRRQPYALLDIDFLGWGVSFADDDEAASFGLLLRNLAAVASNYRQAGIFRFVLAGAGALATAPGGAGAPGAAAG